MYQHSKPTHAAQHRRPPTRTRRRRHQPPARRARSPHLRGAVLAQNIIRGASAPANGASTRRGPHPLRRPPRRSRSCCRHVRGERHRAGRLPRRSHASTCRQRPPRLGIHRLGRRHRRPRAVHASSSPPSRRCPSSPPGRTRHRRRVEALWALHNSVFSLLDLSIAMALLGLSRAGIAAGITPKVFRRLAPVGAAMLVVGTLAGPVDRASATPCRCSVSPASASSSGSPSCSPPACA